MEMIICGFMAGLFVATIVFSLCLQEDNDIKIYKKEKPKRKVSTGEMALVISHCLLYARPTDYEREVLEAAVDLLEGVKE